MAMNGNLNNQKKQLESKSSFRLIAPLKAIIIDWFRVRYPIAVFVFLCSIIGMVPTRGLTLTLVRLPPVSRKEVDHIRDG